MKKILMVFWTLTVACSVSFGQTNKPPPKAASEQQKGDTSPLAHFEDTHTYTLSSQRSQGALPPQDGIISRIGGEGLLTPQPTVPASFRPKIFRVGHVRIYSSVATAVARKNPLCLLDATFLNISF
ncbi:MAG TPA: hypothetical protein VH619_20490 [Verrucomicrobiae bacterium]|jgi:hypothetical protein|nr:hypothetical protein [Verrucomicrobiae bacterium]